MLISARPSLFWVPVLTSPGHQPTSAKRPAVLGLPANKGGWQLFLSPRASGTPVAGGAADALLGTGGDFPGGFLMGSGTDAASSPQSGGCLGRNAGAERAQPPPPPPSPPGNRCPTNGLHERRSLTGLNSRRC